MESEETLGPQFSVHCQPVTQSLEAISYHLNESPANSSYCCTRWGQKWEVLAHRLRLCSLKAT
jgi:hypothetical protein